MSKKSRNVGLDSTAPYVGGVCEDAKARMKFQSLVQDYQELQKEVNVMRSKLEGGKQRKMVLAAEVRFLRRRYQYLVESKSMNSIEKGKLVLPQNLLKRTKDLKKLKRKEAPAIPEPKIKKKHHISKEVTLHTEPPIWQHHGKTSHGRKDATDHNLTPISYLDPQKRTNIKKKALSRNTIPILDLNQKERIYTNEPALRNTIMGFDLNQDDNPSGKEASLPSRTPIFDLNEISTGDEDFQGDGERVKFEEVKKSLMRDQTDELQNDLLLSICRNSGEGPSRAGKRNISWQDPVALRV